MSDSLIQNRSLSPFQSQWKESEDVIQSCSQKFKLFAQTAPAKRSHSLSEDHTERWERSSNEEKQSEGQIQRFKRKKLFHRKRTRKKIVFLRKHLFQSLGKIPKTQDQKYKIIPRDLKSTLISVPGSPPLLRAPSAPMGRIKAITQWKVHYAKQKKNPLLINFQKYEVGGKVSTLKSAGKPINDSSYPYFVLIDLWIEVLRDSPGESPLTLKHWEKMDEIVYSKIPPIPSHLYNTNKLPLAMDMCTSQ